MTRDFPQKVLVLCWLETDICSQSARISQLSKDVCLTANGLASFGGIEIFGALLTAPGQSLEFKELSGLGLTKVLNFRCLEYLGGGAPAIMTKALALEEAIRRFSPEVVLLPADERSGEIAPLTAAALGCGLTAECTGLKLESDVLVQTRPAFGGELIAQIVSYPVKPQMATVRGLLPGAAVGPIPLADPLVENVNWPKAPFKIKVLEHKPLKPVETLEQAKVVVALGLGINGPEGVAKAAEIASKMGAALAGTRSVVDRGWLPPDKQIGLSGKSISAKLLITLGVSGSVQFMAGAGGAKHIVAVNNDPTAPIFSCCHTGILLDVELLLPQLEKLIVENAIKNIN